MKDREKLRGKYSPYLGMAINYVLTEKKMRFYRDLLFLPE
jgi:hypothetical protein